MPMKCSNELHNFFCKTIYEYQKFTLTNFYWNDNYRKNIDRLIPPYLSITFINIWIATGVKKKRLRKSPIIHHLQVNFLKRISLRAASVYFLEEEEGKQQHFLPGSGSGIRNECWLLILIFEAPIACKSSEFL